MIAILKYNAGNIKSVQNALHRLGIDSMVTDDAKLLRQADKVIFPGVGEASTAMNYLKERNLDTVIRHLSQPVLAICLGLQLLCNHSEEGNTSCLGIFNTEVKKFPATDIVPHMGWNTVHDLQSSLFEGITITDDVYFVHNYYAEICEDTIGCCDYILPFSAALRKDNFYATQFHPEKSADMGDRILSNFLRL